MTPPPPSERVGGLRIRLLRMGLGWGVLWASAAHFMAGISNCQQHPVKTVNSSSNRSYETGRFKG